MNKQELAVILSNRESITQQEAIKQIDQVLDVIVEQLANHEPVKLRGFGTFSTALRDEKTVLNPKTKKEIFVPKRHVLVFTASKRLKQEIQEKEN